MKTIVCQPFVRQVKDLYLRCDLVAKPSVGDNIVVGDGAHIVVDKVWVFSDHIEIRGEAIDFSEYDQIKRSGFHEEL